MFVQDIYLNGEQFGDIYRKKLYFKKMESIKLKKSIKIYKLLKRIIEVIKKKYYTLLIKK